MKRHIKFPLFLKDNLPVRTMEELRSNSDIPKLLTYYADGRLAIWLRDRYEDELSEAVRALDPEQEDFLAKLCKLLDIAYDGSVQSNMREIIGRNEIIKKIRQYINDAEILDAPECVAFTQEEFETLCKDGDKEKIWLIGESFALPELKRKVLICGVNMPKITISRESVVCFHKTDSQIQDAEYDKTILTTATSQKRFDMLTEKKAKTIYVCARQLKFKSELYPVNIIGLEPNETIHVQASKLKCMQNLVTFEYITAIYEKTGTGEEIHFAGMDWITFPHGSTYKLIAKSPCENKSRNKEDWDSSDLRWWLNGPFLINQFSDKQKNYLLPVYNQDLVTILSSGEVCQYGAIIEKHIMGCEWLREHTIDSMRHSYFKTVSPPTRISESYETNVHGIRPVILVRDLQELIEQGEVTPCS